MKPLIVPTNFTASSVNAAKYAANMAMMVNSDLYLIHVLQLPVSSAEIPLTKEIYEEMQKSGEHELENLKLELQKQTEGRINIFTLLEIGNVEHKLAELCQRKAPFAVVMGIKKSAAERFVFGSNALISISHLHYPLFVIPEDSSFHALRKMVLAYDLDGPNKNIPVSYLKELQRIFSADLDVLNINAKKRGDLQTNQEYSFIKDMLQGLHPTYHFKIADTVEEGINTFLEENPADLLLLLPKHHSIFEFHKSHTKKMALNTDLPILTIHE